MQRTVNSSFPWARNAALSSFSFALETLLSSAVWSMRFSPSTTLIPYDTPGSTNSKNIRCASRWLIRQRHMGHIRVSWANIWSTHVSQKPCPVNGTLFLWECHSQPTAYRRWKGGICEEESPKYMYNSELPPFFSSGRGRGVAVAKKWANGPWALTKWPRPWKRRRTRAMWSYLLSARDLHNAFTFLTS